MAEISRPDLLVVGAGALGIELCLHARRLGASVVLVDLGRPEPGDHPQLALRLGALVEAASRAWSLRSAARFGLTNGQPRIAFKGLEEHLSALAAERAASAGPEHLQAAGVQVVTGELTSPDPRVLEVGDVRYRPRAVVLATGGVPRQLEIPGLADIEAFTVDTILENAKKLTHLLVIGGNADALALAQAYRRLGSEVTVVPHGPLLAGVDAEATEILLTCLEAEGVKIIRDGLVGEIQARSQGTGVVVQSDGEATSLDVSHVLVSVGRKPDFSAIDIEGLRLRRGTDDLVAAGALGQTSNRMVRVVGHAAGIEQWSGAVAQGRAAIETALTGVPLRMPGLSPILVQTEPALAQIGSMPVADRPARTGQRIIRFNPAENDAARIRDAVAGMVKVALNGKAGIDGAVIVGAGAGETAGVLALAMDRGMTLADLAGLSLPHPSLLEMIPALARSAEVQKPLSPMRRRVGKLRALLPR